MDRLYRVVCGGTRPSCVLLLALLLANLVGSADLRAQDHGTVAGSVTDVQGFALPGATVVLRTTGRGFVASTVTDRTGGFALDNIPAGDYAAGGEPARVLDARGAGHRRPGRRRRGRCARRGGLRSGGPRHRSDARGGDGAGDAGVNDGFASLYGSSDRLRFTFQHNARMGSDYTDGNGDTVEGDYESFDTRWDFGARLGRRTLLEYSGGFQQQNDIDYPGRLLDATFFETQSHALAFSHEPAAGVLTELAGTAYVNRKEHLMNNHNKPTAVRNQHRTPPFPIRVDLPASADTVGGRFHAALETGPLRYKLGFDAYQLRQNATQTVSDRDTGDIHHDRHPVWPEFNVGTTLRAAEATVTLDVFLRNVDDYITVAHDPNLAKRLPLSPDPLFRYVQADAARFAGFDLTATSAVGPWVDLRGGWSYVRAEDLLFDEPLFGVPPFEQRYALDVHNPARTAWVEVLVTSTSAQERVAATRFEAPTEGWTTMDLMGGVRMSEGLTVRAGVQNLTDQYYVNHLNSFNPFTRQRIAELGRSVYVGTEVGF